MKHAPQVDQEQRARLADQEKDLSSREQEIAILLALGWINRDIAEQLRIGLKTVDCHRQHLLQKLQLRNNADVARWAIRRGFIEP